MIENMTTDKQKEYRRHRARLDRYGVSKCQFETMVAERKGKCDMCHKLPCGKRKTLFVDHDHSTGCIRGLLCSSCNHGLGLLGDNAEVPLKVQQYLQSPSLPNFKKQVQDARELKRNVEQNSIETDLYMWMESFF